MVEGPYLQPARGIGWSQQFTTSNGDLLGPKERMVNTRKEVVGYFKENATNGI